MKYITEPKKKLPIYGSYDVVVCGGGPAGIASALSAARNGAKTLLIEQTGCLGGMSTAGLGPNFAPFTRAEKPLALGIAMEVLNKLKAIDGIGASSKTGTSWIAVDSEKIKLLYDRLMEKAGVKVLFFTGVFGVLKKNRKITAAIIENKSGRQAVLGKNFIDATGDADLAAKAGVPFEKGGSKGVLQPVTLCFSAAGIDSEKFKTLRNVTFKGNNTKMTEKTLEPFLGKSLPDMKFGEYRYIVNKDMGNGVWGFNFGHVYNIDGTNADDLSFGIAYGRKIADNFISHARKHISAFKNAQLVQTAQLLGVRETRRIKGIYKYTINDYKSLRKFDDTIAVFDYPVDVHGSNKSKKTFKRHMKQFTTDFIVPYGKYYSIPFRVLIPEKIENLLVPGRSLSADRLTHGALRVMPLCFAFGEAAGLAAAMSCKSGKIIKDTNISLLRAKLKKQGAKID
ncbi:MAG: FAD-dependent oxidoreductase [Candidatus Firestonebacteria bacterium]